MFACLEEIARRHELWEEQVRRSPFLLESLFVVPAATFSTPVVACAVAMCGALLWSSFFLSACLLFRFAKPAYIAPVRFLSFMLYHQAVGDPTSVPRYSQPETAVVVVPVVRCEYVQNREKTLSALYGFPPPLPCQSFPLQKLPLALARILDG